MVGNKYLSFVNGFSGYNQIKVVVEDQEKTTSTCRWGTYIYKVLPVSLCNALATFQRVVITIFDEIIHECIEVYMDDLFVHGDTFE